MKSLIEPKYDWQKADLKQTPDSQKIAAEFDLDPLVAEVLVDKGYTESKEIKAFLEPTIESFYDPYRLFDMQKAVDKIQETIMEGKHITIYGDYDADGLTSTTIMYEALSQLGADVSYYIPDRFTDGYGPNKDVYKRLIEEGTELIITVDNGISGFDAIEFANEQGIEVIVTDHHELPKQLPNAYATIHPRHPKSEYPFSDLSGAGVAFKVATALLEEIPQDLLDLAAIGTVADLVSLTDENRAIVKFGLLALENTLRPGLLALYDIAGINGKEFSADTIGFTLGPRLNAIGRMQHAQSGVELLTTLDEQKATALAKEANDLNVKRQDLVRQITEEALAQLETKNNSFVNVVAGKNWHEGVLGIVASHLVEKTGRPSLVLNIGENGIAKGSGRSVERFHLFNALDGHRDIMVSFGGHHMACGLSIKEEHLTDLQQVLDTEAKNQAFDPTKKQPLAIATKLDASQVTFELFNSLARLAPFGTGNELPLFEFSSHEVIGARAIGKTQEHLRLEVKSPTQTLEAIAFGVKDEISDLLSDPSAIEFVATLDKNSWRGEEKLQLRIKDLKQETEQKALPEVKLERTNSLQKELFALPATYGFFNAELAKRFETHLPEGSEVIVFGADLTNKKVTELVLVDFPQNIAQLEFVLQRIDFDKLRVILYTKALSEALPTRSEFAKVYKYIFQVGSLNIQNELAQNAQNLALSPQKLALVLKVFFEARFVTINNGILVGVKNAKRYRLEDTNSYRTHGQRLQAEKLLLASSDEELTSWLLNHL